MHIGDKRRMFRTVWLWFLTHFYRQRRKLICVCVCGAVFGEGVGVMVFDLLWRLEQQDSAESRLAQQARREWHFLSLSRPAESLDSRDLVLSRVPVHHHQSQPPTAGRVGWWGGLSYLCHPMSLPPMCLCPPSSSSSCSVFGPSPERLKSRSPSLCSPDCFCSCEQTNRVWPLTKENAQAHLILLP